MIYYVARNQVLIYYMIELTNFFGNPEEFKAGIAKLDETTFKIFMAKKEEQWDILRRNHNAYMLFLEDSNDACGRDALCMEYLYEEKERRGL